MRHTARGRRPAECWDTPTLGSEVTVPGLRLPLTWFLSLHWLQHYVSNSFEYFTSTRQHHSSDILTMQYLRCNIDWHHSVGRRTSWVGASLVWNSLPPDIQTSSSLSTSLNISLRQSLPDIVFDHITPSWSMNSFLYVSHLPLTLTLTASVPSQLSSRPASMQTLIIWRTITVTLAL